jgi:hypothetical protein
MGEIIRGKEYNPRRAKQPKDYSGLCYGNITPSDLDGILEFKNKLFIFIEYKANGAPIQEGQKLCLARLANAIQSQKITAVSIIADHYGHIGEDIDCANAEVREFFYKGKWLAFEGPMTVKRLVDHFHQKYVAKPKNLVG